jgi:uncharacterized membrane protein YphA (DoxX/SURF4 family)
LVFLNLLKSVWCYRLIRWVLSMLFIWAGCTKLADPQAFSVIIQDFGIVPEFSVKPIAVILPVLEVTAGIGLIFDIRGSLAVITGLLALFIVTLGYGIWLGLDIDCGCFGPEDPELRAYNGLRSAFYRDLAMMVVIFHLYFWRFRHTAHARTKVIRNNRKQIRKKIK